MALETALENTLLEATVFHHRLLPKRHRLSYRVFYLCFRLKDLNKLTHRFFSLNKFNLLSFYNADHGDGVAEPQVWVHAILQKWNLQDLIDDVILMTMPRVLGYVFNPVSFWFCLDAQKKLRAVVAEVNNTFGERHSYLCCHHDHQPIMATDVLSAEKVFHVSPFLPVEGAYNFRFDYQEKEIGVWIDYDIQGQKTLITSVVGKRTAWSEAIVIKNFFRYPLVTLKVIALIHYHALKLLFKGLRFHKKPEPPQQDVTR